MFCAIEHLSTSWSGRHSRLVRLLQCSFQKREREKKPLPSFMPGFICNIYNPQTAGCFSSELSYCRGPAVRLCPSWIDSQEPHLQIVVDIWKWRCCTHQGSTRVWQAMYHYAVERVALEHLPSLCYKKYVLRILELGLPEASFSISLPATAHLPMDFKVDQDKAFEMWWGGRNGASVKNMQENLHWPPQLPGEARHVCWESPK